MDIYRDTHIVLSSKVLRIKGGQREETSESHNKMKNIQELPKIKKKYSLYRKFIIVYL